MADQQAGSGSEDVQTFVREYKPDLAERVRFAWNGKHASEFVDANQDFRCRVIDHVCSNPGSASPQLLAELFTQSALWAREAWGSPRNFETLVAELLTRCGEDVLPEFLCGFRQSFDTFGACHQMKLDPVVTRRLLQVVEERTATAEGADKQLWDAGRELFSKLAAGTASKGWVVLSPGTPVANMRVVSRWRIWASELWRRIWLRTR